MFFKKSMLLCLIGLTSVACSPNATSFPSTTNVVLESFFDGDEFTEYKVKVLKALSVSASENYILAQVTDFSVNESNVILFVQNGKNFDQYVLDGTLNMSGIGHTDVGISNDKFIEIPTSVCPIPDIFKVPSKTY